MPKGTTEVSKNLLTTLTIDGTTPVRQCLSKLSLISSTPSASLFLSSKMISSTSVLRRITRMMMKIAAGHLKNQKFVQFCVGSGSKS
jgi:hypothetical protein